MNKKSQSARTKFYEMKVFSLNFLLFLCGHAKKTKNKNRPTSLGALLLINVVRLGELCRIIIAPSSSFTQINI